MTAEPKTLSEFPIRVAQNTLHAIEEVYTELGVLIPKKKDLKELKRNLLTELNFSRGGDHFNVQCDFHTNEKYYDEKFVKYCYEQVSKKNILTIRILDNREKKGGGYPIVYIFSNEDIERFFIFSETGSLISLKTINDEIIHIQHHMTLNTYTRQRSYQKTLKGFDNIYPSTSIRLGGSFCLQIDDFSQDLSGKWQFPFSAFFTFNDIGGRMPLYSNFFSFPIPTLSTSGILSFNEDRFIFNNSDSISNLDRFDNIEAISSCIIKQFIKNDGEALAILFSALLKLHPTNKLHSVQALFSIINRNGYNMVGPEVIDFDGFDTLTDWGYKKEILNNQNRLIQDAKDSINKVKLRKWQPHIQFFAERYKDNREANLKTISKSKEVTSQMLEEIKSHFYELDLSPTFTQPIPAFTPKLTGAVILARLLTYLPKQDWVASEGETISILLIEDYKIIKIVISGLEMAFCTKSGILIDTGDVKNTIRLIIKIFDFPLLLVHHNAIKEGD